MLEFDKENIKRYISPQNIKEKIVALRIGISTLKLDKANEKRYVSSKDVKKKMVALGLGATMLGSAIGTTIAKVGNHKQFTVALAQDLKNDEYKDAVPLKDKNGEIIEISDDALVFIKDDEIKRNNKVMVLDKGKIQEGEMQGKYLKSSDIQISIDMLKNYNEVYRVLPDIGANLRENPTIIHSNILCGLAQGELVLGGESVVSKKNEFLWRPVIYINENQIIRGYIKEDLLEKVDEIIEDKKEDTKENFENIDSDNINNNNLDCDNYKKRLVNTDSADGIALNCRENADITAEIIGKIPNGSIVYSLEESVFVEARKWVKIIYRDENENDITGWVSNEYLQSIEKEMQVDTSEDNHEPLNLRRNPSINSEILLKIEDGRKVLIDEESLQNEIESDGHTWVKITIGEQEGYVAKEFLREIQEEITDIESDITLDEIQSKVISNIKTNSIGQVTGIDVSNMTPDQLQLLWTNGITQSSVGTGFLGNIDVSDINGKINYVMIRIGGTYELNPEFQTDSTEEFYIPLVKKCEELGIPYGFYYYSASVDENEAGEEFKKISTSIESLKEELGELKYNLLPFTIDVELNSDNDRQKGKDVTYAKAVLTNQLQDYLNKEVILYGAGKAVTNYYGNNILNLKEYNRLTGVTKVWMPTPKEEYFNSQISQTNLDMMRLISGETEGKMNIVMQQVVLDGIVNNTAVDINTMDKEKFVEMIKGNQKESRMDESEIELR